MTGVQTCALPISSSIERRGVCGQWLCVLAPALAAGTDAGRHQRRFIWRQLIWRQRRRQCPTVGGGTAGNAVAGRLAENPKVRVLVIEAGVA